MSPTNLALDNTRESECALGVGGEYIGDVEPPPPKRNQVKTIRECCIQVLQKQTCIVTRKTWDRVQFRGLWPGGNLWGKMILCVVFNLR